MTPTYFNLFTIYSISNLHDVSWGNREGGGVSEKNQKEKLQSFRAWWFCLYLLMNGAYAYIIIVLSTSYGTAKIV